MDNNNYTNIPKPRYIKEYRKFNDVFKMRRSSDRTFLDKFLLQGFIALIIAAVVLLINNFNFALANNLSKGIKEVISWNIDGDKIMEYAGRFKYLISNGSKTANLSIADEKNMFIMPLEGDITSEFGERVHPVFQTARMHTGIDIAGEYGAPIKSASAGKVAKAGIDETLGKYIKIASGNYELVYAHCSKLNVKEGQIVKQGDIIAEVGDTGLAAGPHLHFEIWENGNAINPLDKLNNAK